MKIHHLFCFSLRYVLFIGIVFQSICSVAVFSGEIAEKIPQSDWPQWRGQNRDGISSEKAILTNWPDTGPEKIWRIEIGEGFSGISAANGALFTMWDEGEGQFLVRLDAGTGKEQWRFRISEQFQNQYGNGPRSTPLVNEGIVYAISADGHLAAVESENGELQWGYDLAKSFGSQIPGIGYSSSPLIEEDLLIVEIGGKEGFAFAAFNKDSGELAWHSQTDLPAYSSPIITELHGERQAVFLSADGLFALSPSDGERMWQYSWKTRCPSTGIPLNTATPVFIHPDKIFISSGYGTVSGGAMVQINKTEKAYSAETVWSTDQMKNLVNSSVYFEGHIYGFDKAILKSIDAKTGEEKWKARGYGRGSLILADGHLIALGERGNLGLIEATPEAYRLISSAEVLEGKSWTSPTLANGKLYLRSTKEMVSLRISAE